MTLSLSVITCSHNPRADYLKQVIDALERQTLAKERWEYLLIDNLSDEPLAARFDLSWHPQAKHIVEERLGLTAARLRGIREAAGEVLVFVDDDNVLDADYLEEVARLSAVWPMVGAFSGQVRGKFEVPPPEWTRVYWDRLAIREFNQDKWSNLACNSETTPNGAGLCVRRRVADQYLSYHENGKRKILLDRTGTSLVSAGDVDLAATACDLGLGNALFASLALDHLMPRERLEEKYLLSLLEAQAFSQVVLDSFRANGQAPLRETRKRAIVNQLRMSFMDPRKRRFFQAIRRGVSKGVEFLANQ